MAIEMTDHWLAKEVLPGIKQARDMDPRVRELLLASLCEDGLMPRTVQMADLYDVDGLIQKLEAIASEG